MTVKKFIKPFIAAQIPAFVRDEYPLFVDFLEAYYEWLDQPGNLTASMFDSENAIDVDLATDAFKEHLFAFFMPDIPANVLVDKTLLAKNIRQFYQARGTEKSFKFLMKILFEDNVEVYYPKVDILRCSDGKWIKDIYRTRVSAIEEPNVFEGFRVLQRVLENGTIPGSGLVENALKVTEGLYRFNELDLSRVNGTFPVGNSLEVLGDITQKGTYYSVLSNVVITDPGTGYFVGQKIALPTTKTFKLSFVALEDDQDVFDTYLTSSVPKASIEVKKNNTLIPDTDYTWDGRVLTIIVIGSLPVEGDDIDIYLPSEKADVVISQVGDMGEIEEVRIVDIGVGYNFLTNPITVTGIGDENATVTVSANGSFLVPGHYKNNDGHLSSTKYLQDSFFYQEFSYVIKTKVGAEKYQSILKRILHPAGFQFFHQFNLKSLISFLISTYVQLDVRVESKDLTIYGYPDSFGAGFNFGLNPAIESVYLYMPTLGPTNESIDA